MTCADPDLPSGVAVERFRPQDSYGEYTQSPVQINDPVEDVNRTGGCGGGARTCMVESGKRAERRLRHAIIAGTGHCLLL